MVIDRGVVKGCILVRMPSRNPRLWLAPVLGGLGTAVGVGGALNELRQHDGDVSTGALVILCLTALVITLSILIVLEQRGSRSVSGQVNQLEAQLRSRELALREAGKSDALTGLGNRIALAESLEASFRQLARGGPPFACVLIDIDRFRRVNDRFGQHFGDVVLVSFTRLLTRLLRGSDLVCRYGGDQFMLLLADTSAELAVTIAERVRQSVKSEVFSDGTAAAALTASFGVATPVAGVERAGALIERVESALAEAKRGGRDRIAIDPDLMQTPNGENIRSPEQSGPAEAV